MKAADSISTNNRMFHNINYEIIRGLIKVTCQYMDNQMGIQGYKFMLDPVFTKCLYTKMNALYINYGSDYVIIDTPTNAFMHDFILFYCLDLNGFKMKKNCHMYNFKNQVVIEKIKKIVKFLIEKKRKESSGDMPKSSVYIPDVLTDKILEYYNVFK
jgi:hypothetical protein